MFDILEWAGWGVCVCVLIDIQGGTAAAVYWRFGFGCGPGEGFNMT
jgi:hypothetical protein